MPRINSPAELEDLRKSILSERDPNKPCITSGDFTRLKIKATLKTAMEKPAKAMAIKLPASPNASSLMY